MTHSTSTRPKRAALALACAGVLAGSLGISAGAHATGTSTARQPVVRMDDLLHPADVAGAFTVAGTTTSRVGAGNGDFGLSGCTGETRTSDAVGSGAHLFHEVVTGAVGDGGSRFTVQQHVADQRSSARAVTTYRALLRAVRECQHEPAGHWRYGAAHRLTTARGHRDVDDHDRRGRQPGRRRAGRTKRPAPRGGGGPGRRHVRSRPAAGRGHAVPAALTAPRRRRDHPPSASSRSAPPVRRILGTWATMRPWRTASCGRRARPGGRPSAPPAPTWSTRSRSSPSSRSTSPGAPASSTWAVARARSHAVSRRAACWSSGIDPTAAGCSVAPQPRRRSGVRPLRRGGPPVRRRRLRRGRDLPRARARARLRARPGRPGPGPAPGRHLPPARRTSAPPGARQRVDRRPRLGRALLAHRHLPPGGRGGRRRSRRACPSSSSTARCRAT